MHEGQTALAFRPMRHRQQHPHPFSYSKIVDVFDENQEASEEEVFLFTKAMNFLIEEQAMLHSVFIIAVFKNAEKKSEHFFVIRKKAISYE